MGWQNIIIPYPRLFLQNPPFVFMDVPHLDAADIFAYLESEDVNGEYDFEAVLLSDGIFLNHTASALTDEPNCETSTDSPFLQYKTQKGNSRLLYGSYSYVLHKENITEDCKRTLKIQINTDVVLKSSVHSCVGTKFSRFATQ